MTALADNGAELGAWLSHRFGGKAGFDLESGLFLWLDRPLLPREYPRRARDLFLLAERIAGDGPRLLEDIAAAAPDEFAVLLGAPSSNGTCLGGVLVRAPRGHDKTARVSHRSYLVRGFREHAVPRELLVRRVLGSHDVVRVNVSRGDASWVHGRDANPSVERLRSLSVTLIGCGAVGAHVAVALAQAGVGQLVLCDPELLTSGNPGRHPLGMAEVGRRKAIALAEHIRARFPQVRNVVARPSRWEDLASDAEIAASSVIVSAVGDWATESSLNEWHVARGQTPPVVYGWTEAHACAGHAVVIDRATSGCFACGFTDRGVPCFQVTQWSGETQRHEPACGALFQPYGPVEIGHTVSLVSELALDVLLGRVGGGTHRIWAARRAFLDDLCGEWTAAWRTLAPHAAIGGCTLERKWKFDPACVECGSMGEAA